MQGLCTTITAGLFVVYIVASEFWNGLLGMSSFYMYIMFIELLFFPAYNFWAAKERYDYKYKGIILVTLIVALGNPITGVIAVLNSAHKAEARIVSYVLIQVCVGLIFYIFNMYKGKRFFDKAYWKFALAFNIPLVPHYLSSVVLSKADLIMIGNMVGKDQAAIYSVAYNIAAMISIVVSAINNSFTPYMYKSIKNGEYDGIRRNSTMLIVLIGLTSIAAMVLGPEVIAIFAPEEYYDAIWVIPPVACSMYFSFLYPLFSTVEFYFEKPKLVMMASCVGAVTNIVLNYLLIPVFGYYAAGYTTLFCYIMYSFAHFYFARKLCNENGIRSQLFNMKAIAILSVVILAAIPVVSLLYRFMVIRYVLCVAALIVAAKYAKDYIKMKKGMKTEGERA